MTKTTRGQFPVSVVEIQRFISSCDQSGTSWSFPGLHIPRPTLTFRNLRDRTLCYPPGRLGNLLVAILPQCYQSLAYCYCRWTMHGPGNFSTDLYSKRYNEYLYHRNSRSIISMTYTHTVKSGVRDRLSCAYTFIVYNKRNVVQFFSCYATFHGITQL